MSTTNNHRLNGQVPSARNPKAAGRPLGSKNLPPELRARKNARPAAARKNGQAKTARNPKAAGRPSHPTTPEYRAHRNAMQAEYRAKYDNKNKRIFAYLDNKQVVWLGDYAKRHKLRGVSPAIRHLIDRAMQ